MNTPMVVDIVPDEPDATELDATQLDATEPSTGVDESRRERQVDTLADSLLVMAVVTIVQKAIGFGRSLLFCRWLTPAELGRWDMMYSFMLLACPLVVLGLPGTFGRYVEHFRLKGQLRIFLRRTALASIAFVSVAFVAMFLASDFVCWLIFGSTEDVAMIGPIAVGVVVITTFNYLCALFTSLRNIRITMLLLLISSFLFATVGATLIFAWQPTALAVLTAYALACGCAAIVGGFLIRNTWRSLATESSTPPVMFWRKLLRFAAWVWVADLVFNLFAVADRYMIVHCGEFSPREAATMVGNLHSSQVLPLLLVSIAGMLDRMIMPHLSHDWETGQHERVSATIVLNIKLVGIVFVAFALSVILFAPWLFEYLLAGKYSLGQAVLPWAFVSAIWCSLALLAQLYLWCAEKVKRTSLVIFIGLLANIALNWWLIPLWGLAGAVAATAIGNGVLLTLFMAMNRHSGLRWDRGTAIVLALPLTLCLGVEISVAAMLLVAILVWRTDWVLSTSEKGVVARTLESYRNKLRR